MLLPSSFSAGPRPGLRRFGAFNAQQLQQQQRLSSPPGSPTTPQGVGGTCRALQSVLGTGHPDRDHLSSGSRSPLSPNHALHAFARVRKRPPPRSRNEKKRLREDVDDDDEDEVRGRGVHGHGYRLGLGNADKDDVPTTSDEEEEEEQGEKERIFSTPKRRRRAPPTMPLGLGHTDFLDLDEGFDEDMNEAPSLPKMPALLQDEGYGSMDIEAEQLDQVLVQLRERAMGGSPCLHAPVSGSDADAMSVGTPASDFAAMVLSPALPSQLGQPRSVQTPVTPDPLDVDVGGGGKPLQYAPEIKISPPPPVLGSSAMADQDPDLPALLAAVPDLDAMSEPLLPRTNRPSLSRLPSLTQSDPAEQPTTPSTPPPPPSSSSNRANTDHRFSWTDADDSALVGLVVDRMRLKKRDWDEFARALGADGYGASLGRRWRELVGDGCVGLRFSHSAAAGYTAEDARAARRDARRFTVQRAGRPDVRSVRWG